MSKFYWSHVGGMYHSEKETREEAIADAIESTKRMQALGGSWNEFYIGRGESQDYIVVIEHFELADNAAGYERIS